MEADPLVAGIDLSALIDTIDALGQLDEPQEALTELASQISAQLQQGAASVAQVDGALPGAVVPLAENMAQARQQLQRAIDSAVASVKPQVAVTEATDTLETTLLEGESQEEIDPRFAGLLNVRSGSQRGGEAVAQRGAQIASRNSTETSGVDAEGLQIEVEPKPQGQVAQLGQPQPGTQQGTNAAQLHAQPHANLAGGQSHGTLDAGRTLSQSQPVITLSSGTQVSESQIFDQVVTHLSGSANGETGRMVLRLNPGELGTLKIDLQIEGDKVRANLHAQSQQVQEVIERNLPQLRNALAEQGLKIDQFQVDVDQQPREEFARQGDREQQKFSDTRDWQQGDDSPEAQAIPLGHLLQNGGGGISVHA
jgi:flagellar hook-length control protein FliK